MGSYEAIPGAAEALEELDARGIPWIALTNGSAYPARVQAPRLRAVGLPVPDERLFTPNSVAAKVIADRGLRRVLVLGTAGVAEALEELGVHLRLARTAAEHADCDAVYVAWHPDCTMPHLHAACERCWQARRCSPHPTCRSSPPEEGRSFGYSCAINGAIARVTGAEPEPTGKPSAHAMEFRRRTAGACAGRTLAWWAMMRWPKCRWRAKAGRSA